MSTQPKKKRETKIKYRILRLALISVTVCVVSLMIVLSATTLMAYNKNYKSQTQSLAIAYGEIISNTLNSLALEIESAGGSVEAFDQSIPIEARKETLNQLAATTMFKDFAVAFENGTTYNNTDISDREYFKTALNEQKVAISAPVIRKTDGSVTTMMAAPTNHDGKKYVIYGGIDSAIFCNGLDRIDMGKGSNIVVLDKNGQVIAATDDSLVLTMANYLTGENKGEKALAEKMLAGGEGTVKYNNGTSNLLAYYMPIEGTDGWVIAVSANYDEIITAVFVDIGIGVVLSLLLMVIGTFISI
ncbi:MAG: cache domain-containing protein, partial [Oscillospiraceae bacterium]